MLGRILLRIELHMLDLILHHIELHTPLPYILVPIPLLLLLVPTQLMVSLLDIALRVFVRLDTRLVLMQQSHVQCTHLQRKSCLIKDINILL
jgi:hypothetical protein